MQEEDFLILPRFTLGLFTIRDEEDARLIIEYVKTLLGSSADQEQQTEKIEQEEDEKENPDYDYSFLSIDSEPEPWKEFIWPDIGWHETLFSPRPYEYCIPISYPPKVKKVNHESFKEKVSFWRDAFNHYRYGEQDDVSPSRVSSERLSIAFSCEGFLYDRKGSVQTYRIVSLCEQLKNNAEVKQMIKSPPQLESKIEKYFQKWRDFGIEPSWSDLVLYACAEITKKKKYPGKKTTRDQLARQQNSQSRFHKKRHQSAEHKRRNKGGKPFYQC